MRIEEFTVTGKFKYLWMKSVSGTYLKLHCARCLAGEYVEPAEDINLDGDIYYLCGVATPSVWANNFHLAFHHAPGSEVIADHHGIYVRISDAEELPISKGYIDQTSPYADNPRYSTCRNWWFAWYAFKVLGLPALGTQ